MTADPEFFDLLEAELPERDVYYSTTCGFWNGRNRLPILGLRTGDRVVHFAPDGGEWGEGSSPDGDWRLFDTRLDPSESTDIRDVEPDVAERLVEAVRARERELRERRSSEPIGAGEATLERLRDLGYIEGE